MRSLRQTYILRVWNGAPPHAAHGAAVEAPYGAPVDAPTGAFAGSVSGARIGESASEAASKSASERTGAVTEGTPNSSAANKGGGNFAEGSGNSAEGSGNSIEGGGDVAISENAERFYCSLQTVSSEEVHYFSTLEEAMRFLRSNAVAFRFKPR